MSELRFTPDHEWLRSESDGTYTVGITRYAQQQLGDIVFVELPAVGARFGAGDEAVVIESVKAAADVRMPLDGEVVAVNTALDDAPEKLNEDPMRDGWILRIRPDGDDELDALLDADAYRKLTDEPAAAD